MNKVLLIGNVGRDPELKQINENYLKCFFTVCTSKSFSKNGEIQTKTEWHNIVAWNKTAEYIGKYIGKGDKVYIEGEINTRSYESNETKKTITEINVSEIHLVKKKLYNNNENDHSLINEPPRVNYSDDEIMF